MIHKTWKTCLHPSFPEHGPGRPHYTDFGTRMYQCFCKEGFVGNGFEIMPNNVDKNAGCRVDDGAPAPVVCPVDRNNHCADGARNK